MKDGPIKKTVHTIQVRLSNSTIEIISICGLKMIPALKPIKDDDRVYEWDFALSNWTFYDGESNQL